MKVFTYLEDLQEFDIKGSVIALGNFDGVHKGHQELLKRCVSIAKEKGLTPMVFTFLNHPSSVMSGRKVKNIMTLEEKTAAIEAMGIEYMVTLSFDQKVMKCMPEDFVKTYLVDAMKAKELVCGFNYSYGYKAMGNPETLAKQGESLGYKVNVIPNFMLGGQTVSSTLLRLLIAEGRIEEYPLYTGRPYTIHGKVMQGQKLGRTIGFPTVNLALEEDSALPENGVYITKTHVGDRVFGSVTNVGNKPSVGDFTKNAETHLFGFDEDIYGHQVTVEFIKMTRQEFKFSSLGELAAQIQEDCRQAREYHEKEGLL